MKKIIFIGDINGRPGRETVKKLLPSVRSQYCPDLVIANGENCAGGMGINKKKYDELTSLGIDVVTGGNHVWHCKNFASEIDSCPAFVRPANYPPGAPGRGSLISKGIGVISLLGRVFMKELDCPFRCAEVLMGELKKETRVIVVDLHAEATSEKTAFAHFSDGRSSAVLGTHTHVQTADERILSQGTAFITDVGMCGSYDSVIGVDKNAIIQRFISQMPHRFEVESKGPLIFNAVYLEIDEESGRALKIERINRVID
ncbi:MAG: TIGR00282 family metallophosphoesterase [Candidatus Margulisiibacteriota bacterium]